MRVSSGAAAILAALLVIEMPAVAAPLAVRVARIAHFDASQPQRVHFGALTFRGGLVLSSNAPNFGGFSGLRLDAHGTRFWAQSDRGYLLRGRISYDKAGRPDGIEDADLSPLRDAHGPLGKSVAFDTEGLDVHGSHAWVTAEQVQQLFRFPVAADGSFGVGHRRAMPVSVRKLPGNAGLEAVVEVPAGAPGAGNVLVIAESTRHGVHPAWLVPPKGPARALSVAASDNYSVTDVDFLPSGDLVLLERRYTPPFSLSMRIRRLDGADLKAGVVLDGPVLMEASLDQEIDNMEGLAVSKDAQGRTVLSLMSDDNFKFFERTLLLQFTLEG